MKHKILIVEDDETILSSIVKSLKMWDLDARGINDFHDVTSEFIAYNPSLVIMDIGLPFYNGYKWCEDIRKLSKVPIIFLSSMSDNMNIVMAINMGGDDFIAKPFDTSVLVAKVLALLRRTYDYHSSLKNLSFKDIILNVDDSSVSYLDKKIDLSKNEFRILKTLFENSQKIVSRELLMQKLWETDIFIDDNTLSVNITRLRKKLEDIGIYDLIETKKGQGYCLKND